MKFTAILSALALAVASSAAEECSVLDLAGLATKTEFYKLAFECEGLAAGEPPATDVESMKKFCADSGCVSAMKGASTVAPKCEVQGVAFNTAFETVLTACAVVTGTQAPSGTQAPAPSQTGAASSAPLATAAAAATAVVLALAHA